jgi:acyl-coenzyme A synthetase/AMP-(fatty) acid ligase
MHRHGVTQVAASTLALRSFLIALPRDEAPPPALETIEAGGSVVPHPLLRDAMARLCPDVTVYLGSTEMGGIAAAHAAMVLARRDSQPGLVGSIFPGIRVQAVDEAGDPLPPGREGVLRVTGPTAAPGYFGEQQPAEAFRDGWFYPGDIGTVWPDGMLSLSGRVSDVINSGGMKVSPEIIEERLLALAGVSEAAAFGVPDAGGVERVWAAIVADPPVDEALLDAFCDRSPKGQAPEVILRLASLPKTESGKVLRRALREMALTMTH